MNFISNKLTIKSTTIPLCVLFSLLLNNYTAHAQQGGGMDSGGGRSVVCRDSEGKINSRPELFDFFEGRVQYRVNPQISQEPYEKQVSAMIQTLGQGRGASFTETLQSYANYIMATKEILPDGTGLIPVDDSNHFITPPKGCAFEQLANYTGPNQILVNGEIWNALDETNKAGLIIHEALYKVFRMYGATDSRRARKTIAMVFSGRTPQPHLADIPENALKCHTLPNANGSPFPGSSFYAYNREDGNLVFQFEYLDGQLIVTKSTISPDKIPVEKLLDPDQDNWSIYWLSLFSNYDFGLGVSISFKPKEGTKTGQKEMKIGIGNQPHAPTQEFKCTR